MVAGARQWEKLIFMTMSATGLAIPTKLNWWKCCKQYDRYGYINGHGFVVASSIDDDSILKRAVEMLQDGDVPAMEAAEYIEQHAAFLASDKDPVKAMEKVREQMREKWKSMNGPEPLHGL